MIDMSIIGHKDFEYTHTQVPLSFAPKLISWVQYTNKVINVQSRGRNRPYTSFSAPWMATDFHTWDFVYSKKVTIFEAHLLSQYVSIVN